MQAEAQVRHEVAEGSLMFSAEEEFSLSTEALIHVLLDGGAVTWRSKSEASASKAQRCKELLQILLDKSVGTGSFLMRPSCLSEPLPLAGGMVDFKVLKGTPLSTTRLKTKSMLLSEAMLTLEIMRQPKGCLAETCRDMSLDILRSMVELIVCRAELTGCFGEAIGQGHLALPVLRLKTNKPRRIPMAKKQQIVSDAGASQTLHTPFQLVAAEAILNKRKGEAATIRPSSANRFVQQAVYQYWLAGRKAWAKASHLSVAADAGRVGDDDLLQNVHWSSELGVGCWGPPQVCSKPMRWESQNQRLHPTHWSTCVAPSPFGLQPLISITYCFRMLFLSFEFFCLYPTRRSTCKKRIGFSIPNPPR